MDEVAEGSERDGSDVRIVAVRGPAVIERSDRLAGEEPLEISAAGPGQEPVSVAVTMRTRGHDEELAAGFLFSEGLVAPGEIVGFELGDPGRIAQPENEIRVRIRRPFDASLVAERNFVATASCGICGRASLDTIALRCDPVGPGPRLSRSVLVRLPGSLRDGQHVFATTGGLHASGLFDPTGRLLLVREDIGRHNALDKVIGRAVLDEAVPLVDRVVLVSGRIGYEIAQKAATAGVAILCAVSAPSDLAVAVAERFGVTLVGFLRGDRFNVYSRPDRIDLAD